MITNLLQTPNFTYSFVQLNVTLTSQRLNNLFRSRAEYSVYQNVITTVEASELTATSKRNSVLVLNQLN